MKSLLDTIRGILKKEISPDIVEKLKGSVKLYLIHDVCTIN